MDLLDRHATDQKSWCRFSQRNAPPDKLQTKGSFRKSVYNTCIHIKVFPLGWDHAGFLRKNWSNNNGANTAKLQCFLGNMNLFLSIWIPNHYYSKCTFISLSDRIITNWKHKTWRVKLKIGVTQVSWTPSTLEELTNGHICECNISWLRGLWVQILLRPKFFSGLNFISNEAVKSSLSAHVWFFDAPPFLNLHLHVIFVHFMWILQLTYIWAVLWCISLQRLLSHLAI